MAVDNGAGDAEQGGDTAPVHSPAPLSRRAEVSRGHLRLSAFVVARTHQTAPSLRRHVPPPLVADIRRLR